MLYNPATRAELRAWLIKTLDPICDADPVILSDYVIALLNHDGPELELRNMFLKQLEEFLEREPFQETQPFVDSLFSALRSKAYVPYATMVASSSVPTLAPGPSDSGIPIPLDVLVSSPKSPKDRGRKRAFDADDREHDHPGRPLPKEPRLHKQTNASRYPSSNSRNNGSSSWKSSHNQPQDYQTDDGAVVDAASHLRPNNGRGPGASVDPGKGDSDFRTAPEPKPLCRDYHNKGYCARGAFCNYSHGEDAMIPPNPMWLPPDNSNFNAMMNMSFLPMMMPFGMPGGTSGLDGGAYDPNESRFDMPGSQPYGPAMLAENNNMMVDSAPPVGPTDEIVSFQERPHPNGRVRDGAKPNGARSYHSFGRGATLNDKTLVVEKIPPEHLSLDAVNEWFKRFGKITNVAIENKGSKALVSFSIHDEAVAAWKDEGAVFGNRFVKVYWHRPMEGQGTAGKRALEASAPLIQTMASGDALPVETQRSRPQGSKSADGSGRSAGIAAKAQALEKNIAEQKVLFSRLKTAKGEEKNEILARLRALSDSMGETTTSNSTPQGEKPEPVRPTSKLELLDKELDLQQAVQDLTRRAQDPNEDHGAVRGELEKLMAKAASEGIHVGEDEEALPGPSFQYSRGRRPYRGRGWGRPRGSFRGYGRGTGVSKSLKLDNRPKQLLVRGVPPDNDHLLEHVREWHQASGQADTMTFNDNGDIVVQFKTRTAAEQALAGVDSLKPQINGVNVTWPSMAVVQNAMDHNHTEGSRTSIVTSPAVQGDNEESGWGHEDYD